MTGIAFVPEQHLTDGAADYDGIKPVGAPSIMLVGKPTMPGATKLTV